jgi:hypothetical protein
MGLDPDITVVTAEPEPLSGFGRDASAALPLGARRSRPPVSGSSRERLCAWRNILASSLATDSSGPAIPVDRVVAIPVLRGPAITGVACDYAGFIRAAASGLVEDCTRTWAAAIASCRR